MNTFSGVSQERAMPLTERNGSQFFVILENNF